MCISTCKHLQGLKSNIHIEMFVWCRREDMYVSEENNTTHSLTTINLIDVNETTRQSVYSFSFFDASVGDKDESSSMLVDSKIAYVKRGGGDCVGMFVHLISRCVMKPIQS